MLLKYVKKGFTFRMGNLKKNYIYRLFYEILTMIIPFITTPYVSRVLGPDGIGTFSYVYSYIAYFTMFAALGTSSYGMREIARCRDDKEEYSKRFWEIELLSIITSSVCVLTWMFVILFSNKFSIYFIALTPYLIATMFDISWFYTGQEKVGYAVLWNAICKILGTILIFLIVKEKDDLFIYILINSLTVLIGNVSMWIFLPKLIIKASIKTLSIKKHFKETLVYFIPTIATSIYTVLDKTLIGIITKDSYQNGYYEQANKIIRMVNTAVFVSINSIMESRISYLFINNKIDEIKVRIEKSISYIMLLGYAAMFGIMAISNDFVPIFFGEGYIPVVYLLYFMSPLIVIISISNCLGSHYYTPAGHRAQSAKYIIIGSCINFVCNLFFIPIFKAIGAVIGSIISELCISLLYLKNCNNYLTISQIWKNSYKRIIAGGIMLLSIKYINCILSRGIIFMIIKVCFGALVYFFILLLLKDSLIRDYLNIVKLKFKKKEVKING